MSKKSINLNAEEFNRIFPFFILLDEKLIIIDHGESLEKIIPDCAGKAFESLFDIERPHLEEVNFENIKAICTELLILKTKDKLHLKLRGQWEFLKGENHLLFIGAPWFDSSLQFDESGLLIKDFAPHNPLIDMLHAIRTQEIVNEELKEVLRDLNRKKNKLQVANEEIKTISTSLEESNKRYEFVNKATSEAIWDWNILTGEVYYGDGFNKLFGHDVSNLPQNLNIWEQRIHSEDLDPISNEITKALESTNDRWTGEYRYLKANGKYANVVDRGFIIRDDAGHPKRMIGTISDVTLQKEEVHHLKLLESVITNASDGVLITTATPDNSIVYVNEAFTRMTGYSSEEVLGKNPRIFQGPKSDRAALNLMTEAIKSWEPYELTTINYKKNGEEFWLTFSISPVSNDKGIYTHWISIERDVTEMIRANEEIANQKKFTEDILNNIPTDIAVFDPNHNYLFINPCGIKNKEIREWMINKNDFDYTNMKGIDDTLARRRWDIFEEAVETKNTVEWIDEHKTPDGKTNFILRHFYPYFERNRLKFVIGYGIDITERKLIEIKLNEAIVSIKKTNTELEQFAYVASHDLQEPLRMVTSFLSQLEKKYSDKLDDKAKEYIFYAVDGAKRMRQIILDLLEFSRAGKSDDKIKDIDINEIVKEIQFLHHKQIEELNAIITTNNLPIIKGYVTPLRQIFQNLIGNSLKYHRKGIPPEIKITAVESENAWEFSIIDNGIGIESQYFEKIFVIFQRLHNKEDYAGTGIGLALTKKIIENMGGSIWVDSSENTGSSFHFTIPFKQNKTDIDQ